MMHEPLTEYRGFLIDRFNTIFKDGKPMFTAYWQYNYDLQHAKNRIDDSLAHKLAQMPDKQAALGKLMSAPDTMEQDAERDEDKVNDYWERENEK